MPASQAGGVWRVSVRIAQKVTNAGGHVHALVNSYTMNSTEWL